MSFETPIYPTNGLRFLNNPDFPTYPVPQEQYPIDRPPAQSISSPTWIQPTTPARLPLRINIVGAGLGGLATAIALTLSGHRVKLFEQAAAFGEVGAGIQVPPNSTRYLLAWGIGPHLEPHISEPQGIRMRRWQDGELISITSLLGSGPTNRHQHSHGDSNDNNGVDSHAKSAAYADPAGGGGGDANSTGQGIGFREKFGAPYFVVHRADYHGALVARCRELNIDIREGSEVVAYEVAAPNQDEDADRVPDTTKESPFSSLSSGEESNHKPGKANPIISLVLRNGERHAADLIIAADGLKSPARTAILRSHNLKPVTPQSAAQAAYRATVPLSQLKAHPATAWITETPNQNLWIGPSRHAMTYSIGGPTSPNRVFNLVLSHAESRPPDQWSTDPAQVRREMKAYFAGWDARLLSVLDRVAESSEGRVVKWPIMTTPPLQTWVHSSRRMMVMGDAAHAMVPYMSQGAAIAVEDAAAIAALLGLVESEEEIGEALECFERVRMPRASGMQQAGRLNGEIWHLEDGVLQRARDEGARWSLEMLPRKERTSVSVNETGSENKWWNSNQWSDPACQAWTYGYDAAGEALRAWLEQKSGINKT